MSAEGSRKLTLRRIVIAFVPLVALIGWFIVAAEPAVHVLNAQVEEISAGAVSKQSMHATHRE